MTEMTKDLQAVIDGLKDGKKVRVLSLDIDYERVIEVIGEPPTTLRLQDRRHTWDVAIDSTMAFEVY